MFEIKSKRFLKSGFKRNVGGAQFHGNRKSHEGKCIFMCFHMFSSFHVASYPGHTRIHLLAIVNANGNILFPITQNVPIQLLPKLAYSLKVSNGNSITVCGICSS